jgi:GNAT superfamily N-acetyltransferase
MRHLRTARREDLARIWEIRNGVRENRLTDPDAVTDEDVLWYIDQAVFLVAEVDGVIVGFASGDHLNAWLFALFVDPAHEGQGHGRALHDAVLARLAEIGHRQAWLSTDPGTRAAGFYAAAGWRETGRQADGQSVFVKPL